MSSPFANITKIPELRQRIMATLGMLAVYRLGIFVTTPGVDRSLMQQILKQQQGEYMGSLLSAWMESMGSLLREDGTGKRATITDETMDAGLNVTVKDNDRDRQRLLDLVACRREIALTHVGQGQLRVRGRCVLHLFLVRLRRGRHGRGCSKQAQQRDDDG